MRIGVSLSLSRLELHAKLVHSCRINDDETTTPMIMIITIKVILRTEQQYQS